MKYLFLATICLASVSLAFAEEEKKIEKLGEQPATQVTVDPPELSAESEQPLFERVRGAHARAVGRGVVTL